jgi:CRP/FNR family cyclic AMP-dependent transcriptional regulator
MDPDLKTFIDAQDFHPHISLLAKQGEITHFRKGNVLIREGDQSEGLFLVLKGSVRAFSMDRSGKEITFGIYFAGDYVGEMALDGGGRSANVEAMEATTCSLVHREALVAFIGQYPEFSMELLARVIRRARMATESARNLAFIDVYGRLNLLLCEMAQPTHNNGERLIPQKLTHQQIAGLVGCSREMVSRILKDLVLGGYIRIDQKQMTLCKNLPAKW